MNTSKAFPQFILLVAIFLFFCYYLTGQEIVSLNPAKRLSQYPLNSWDMDRGMPSDISVGLLQDSIGYVWVSTYKGIARFDGVNFTIFNSTNTNVIESVTIQAATSDNKNNLWFASQKGLVKYTTNGFVRDSNLNLLNSTSVEALYYDDKTTSLWIGTTSQGLFRYKSNRLESFPKYFALYQEIIKAINKDYEGNIWIGTEGGKIIKYDGEAFLEKKSSHITGGIGSFHLSKSGNFWAAAENGVFKLVEDKFVLQQNIPVEKVNVIIEDNHNTLWIGSNNGLFRYNFFTGNLDVLNEQTGLPNNLVMDLLADRDGNLWIATYRKGIVKLTDGLITTYSESEGLSSDIITAITQEDENVFYVADEQGVINILKNGEISELKLRTKISNDRLKSIYVDTKKNLWISTYTGLIKRSPLGKEDVFGPSTGFPTESFRLVFEDNEGNIWVGTRSNGLYKLKSNGSILEFNLSNGLSSNYIMAVNQDKRGRIVICTKNGINIINGDSIVNLIDMEVGIPSNFSFNVHIDDQNVFWVASNDGLIRIENDDKIFVYNTENGLLDNTLFDVLEDDFGFLWLPTDFGIVRISKEELNNFAFGKTANYNFTTYTKSDGLKVPRCVGATKSLKATDGRLFFPTSGGVAIIDPREIEVDRIDLRVIFEELLSDDKLLESDNSYLIGSKVTRLQFNYTAINYRYVEKIRFRYRLEPFDSQWINAGSSRSAFYTNLSPGNYSFTVQASITGTDWNDHSITTNVLVKRVWWKTWWFRFVIALVFTFLIWLIYKARTYSVKARNIELERLVNERTLLIDQQNKELENQSKELEKLSIVASHTHNAVMIMDAKGNIKWVNDAFTRIYGYSVEEFIREKGENLIWISNDPNIQYIIQKCVDEKVPTNYTVKVFTKDGKPVWIQTNLTPVKNIDNTVRAIVAIDSDITELKQVEAEMIALNDEILVKTESILQQKEEIQAQRDELEQMNNLLIKHTQNIEASILYALTIQKAILPTKDNISNYFECCIVFKPRDIVSGDFYWYTQLPSKDDGTRRFLFAVVDCTGHGVPGALMSMIGSRLLSEIVNERRVTNPSEILTQLNRLVNFVLKQDSEDSIDGMDIAICLVERDDNLKTQITFSGANRPLYLFDRENWNFKVFKGNRKSIGGIMPDLDTNFSNQSFFANPGDFLIMNTDGFTDQNGIDGRKYSVQRLHQEIIEKANSSFDELGNYLDISFDEYRGANSQRDDATILILKI